MDAARIAEHMAGQSTEELLAVVGAPEGEFEPVAVALAKEELGRRSVPLDMPAATEAAGARCSAHPDKAALGTCARCGRFICFGCRYPAAGEHQCRACAERESRSAPRLNGWLIFSALPLFAFPLLFASHLLGFAAWLRTSHAHATLAPSRFALGLWLGDLIRLGVMSGLGLFLIPKYFGRRASVPRWMQLFFACDIAQALAGLAVGAALGAGFSFRGLPLPLAISVAWIIYFRFSRRVARTFVR